MSDTTAPDKSPSERLHDTLAERFFDAISWVDELDAGDARSLADDLQDDLIETLRKHPAFATARRFELELLLADVCNRHAARLTKMIDGLSDTRDVVNAIAEHLIDEMREASRSRKKGTSDTDRDQD
jgi:hypothetical protein